MSAEIDRIFDEQSKRMEEAVDRYGEQLKADIDRFADKLRADINRVCLTAAAISLVILAMAIACYVAYR